MLNANDARSLSLKGKISYLISQIETEIIKSAEEGQTCCSYHEIEADHFNMLTSYLRNHGYQISFKITDDEYGLYSIDIKW